MECCLLAHYSAYSPGLLIQSRTTYIQWAEGSHDNLQPRQSLKDMPDLIWAVSQLRLSQMTLDCSKLIVETNQDRVGETLTNMTPF